MKKIDENDFDSEKLELLRCPNKGCSRVLERLKRNIEQVNTEGDWVKTVTGIYYCRLCDQFYKHEREVEMDST